MDTTVPKVAFRTAPDYWSAELLTVAVMCNRHKVSVQYLRGSCIYFRLKLYINKGHVGTIVPITLGALGKQEV